jgi:hypothetical protein
MKMKEIVYTVKSRIGINPLFYSIYLQTILGGIAHNVPAVYDVLSALQMRSICRADKMCRSNGVGMERSD